MGQTKFWVLFMLQENREMHLEICVHFATHGCRKQFPVVQKIGLGNKPKSKGQIVCFQGLHAWLWWSHEKTRKTGQTMNHWPRHQQHRHHGHTNDSRWGIQLTIYRVDSKKQNGSCSTKWREKKNCGIEIQCRVCSAPKGRRETCCRCSTFGVALWKIPCFGEYRMKKNYWTGTQELNMIPRNVSKYLF